MTATKENRMVRKRMEDVNVGDVVSFPSEGDTYVFEVWDINNHDGLVTLLSKPVMRSATYPPGHLVDVRNG